MASAAGCTISNIPKKKMGEKRDGKRRTYHVCQSKSIKSHELKEYEHQLTHASHGKHEGSTDIYDEKELDDEREKCAHHVSLSRDEDTTHQHLEHVI